MKKFGLGETPRRSKMRCLEEWKKLIALGAREVFLASCAFGSIHQKEFCFLGAHMQVELLRRPCSRDHDHVPIQGSYTKPSATYVEGLAVALATFFCDHLRAKNAALARLQPNVQGLEDVLTHDICVAVSWEEVASWRWKGRVTSISWRLEPPSNFSGCLQRKEETENLCILGIHMWQGVQSLKAGLHRKH